MRAYLLAIALIASACGGEEDSGSSSAKAPTTGGGAKAPAKKGPATKEKELKPMTRIEDRVSCPTPSDAKKCDPKAPVCGANQYCIAAGKDFYCGACPERDAIRHTFKPRDFAGPDLRDPFQSFVITQGLNNGPDPTDRTKTDPTPKCTRKDQFQASMWNYQQLKLAGIVSQGTQRKVLLMGGNMGYIVKKGDCVGKEKAVVRDIGAAFVTFQVDAVGKTDPVEYSMQLYPTQVSMNTPDAIDPGAASAPIVAPPTAGGIAPPTPTPAPAPAPTGPQTTTTIIQDKSGSQIAPPQQAPTQLKP